MAELAWRPEELVLDEETHVGAMSWRLPELGGGGGGAGVRGGGQVTGTGESCWPRSIYFRRGLLASLGRPANHFSHLVVAFCRNYVLLRERLLRGSA